MAEVGTSLKTMKAGGPEVSVAEDFTVLEQGRSWADRLGICLSALCLVHCILTPILLVFLPSLQILEFHEAFHSGLLIILPVLAVAAFIPGYRRHRDRRVFYWSLPGLAIVAVVALFFEHADLVSTAISVSGSLMLIRAHLLNRRLCACCEGHGH